MSRSPDFTDPPLLTRFRMSENTFMLVAAMLIGCLGGLGAVGFRELIHLLHKLAWGAWESSAELIHSLDWWWVILVPALGGLIVGPLVYFLAREAKGHGVPEVMEAVALNSGFIRQRVVVVKSLASALTIASGGSVGREGPIVQIGSALGSAVGQRLNVSGRRLRTLVGCGAAAGVAATFNAPLAGALFAVEIILGDFAVSQFSPIVISSVLATVVSRQFLGDVPAFVVPEYPMVSPWELIFYLILGVAAALVAVTFVRTLYAFEDRADALPVRPWLLTPIGGLIIGATALAYPQILGVGYEAIEGALRGELALGFLAILVGLKILTTSITIASGGSGGIFAPSLFLGAMTGGTLGTFFHNTFPQITAPSGAYALVGMGAVVAAATHAPITAILIIFELTYDYSLIVPLMGSCIIATAVATRIRSDNIYTRKLLRRGVDISAGRDLNILRALQVGEVMDDNPITVAPGAQLGTLVDRATASPEAFIYVVDDDRTLHGVIGYAELREALVQMDILRDVVVAADLARADVPRITPDQTLDVVMQIFSGKNREELPVVESAAHPRLLGTITRGHLIETYNRELMKRDMVTGMAGSLAGARNDPVTLGQDHWMAAVSAPGEFQGRTIAELDVRRRFGVQVILVRKPRSSTAGEWLELAPGPDTRVSLGDQLVVVGSRQAVDRLRSA